MEEELWSGRYDVRSYSIGHRQRTTHDFFFFHTWRQFPSHAANASIHPVFTVDLYSGGCLYLIPCSIWGAPEYNRPDAAVILSPQGVVCLLYHFLGGRQSRLCLRAPPSSSCVNQGVCFVARFEGIGKPPIRRQNKKKINAPLNKEAHGIIFFWRAKHRLYIVCMINSAIVTHTHTTTPF